MSVQVRARREAAAFLSTYVGAQGELLVDTTNNRVQVHDGATPGGWPAARLAEVVTNTRTSIADASYNVLASDRTIAVTSLSAARTVTLPSSSTYPIGTQLLIFDESGACSATNVINVARAGTDTINGAAIASIATAYGYLALESNGAGKWTVVDQTVSAANAASALRTPIADANYTALSSDRVVSYASITAARSVTLPSASGFPVGTRLLILDESGSASASTTITLARAGTDTINGATSATIAAAYGYVAVQSNGASKWTITDQPGGASTGTRTAVTDANYTALTTDRTIAYSALTASRTVTLPAASVFPTGAQLFVVDETGTCASTRTITIARAGADTINGATNATVATAYGFLALISNGTSKWTIVDFAGATQAQLTNRNAIINGNFSVNQRTYASGTALVAGAYAHDRWKAGSGGCTYTFTQAVPDTGATITAGTLIQAVEGANVTATSCWLSWAGTATARVWQGSASGSYAASPILVTGLSAGTIANIEFATGTCGLVQFEAALPGAGPTLFERRSVAAETALCQRYYWISAAFAGGWGGATTTITVAYTFPVAMRVTPQVALLNGSVNGGSALELTVAQRVVSALPSGGSIVNTSGGRTDLTTAAAAGTFRPGILEAGTLGFSAEI